MCGYYFYVWVETGPSVAEPEGRDSVWARRVMGLAAATAVAHAGRGFREPDGEDLEGPGEATGSAALSGASHWPWIPKCCKRWSSGS